MTMYLYKNNQPFKQVTQVNNQPNLHEDNLKDIDRRLEPMETAMQPVPPAENYIPDETTDPGITERQTIQNDFPSWVFIEYKLSPNNFWGKKWQDGKEHLVPKASVVQSVIDIHTEGEKNIGKMIELALGDSNKANMRLLLDAYSTMFIGVDKIFTFPMMRSLGTLAQSALAERAFQKHNYLMAAGRIDQNQDEPEWFANLRSRMIQASTIAGTWCRVHSEMWQLLEYKNNPTYGNVANEIKLRMVNHAKWLEDNYAPQKFERPSVADQHALAAMC